MSGMHFSITSARLGCAARNSAVVLTAALAIVAIAGDGAGNDASARSKKAAHKYGGVHHARVHKRSRTARREQIAVAARPDTPADTANSPLPFPTMTRQEILDSDPGRLERLGRHIIVGYHSIAEVRALVERKAIAGVFVTDHNVRRRKVAAIKAEINSLQEIRARQGLPPLIVAADQEGGSVSRLSPPLKRQQSLARILARLEHDPERKAAVEDYAVRQAQELQRIGVSWNFAPVVDLKLDVKHRNDGETRLRTRAIGADPYLVAKVAGWYCNTMVKAGIVCTLKHFPGLGRVRRDTHVRFGEINASEGKLELNDWVPFRRVMKQPGVSVMLGHVFVDALDTELPASYSPTIIQDLIRKKWRYDGLLVTDDFSMGAITGSQSKVGGAAVKSLNAGADLLLVSYLERHFNAVMSELIRADREGRLSRSSTAHSRDRIGRVLQATLEPNE